MAKKALTAGQLIPTSSTPPSNAGFYRIDKNTIGVVGNLVQKNAQTNVESNVLTTATGATGSGGGGGTFSASGTATYAGGNVTITLPHAIAGATLILTPTVGEIGVDYSGDGGTTWIAVSGDVSAAETITIVALANAIRLRPIASGASAGYTVTARGAHVMWTGSVSYGANAIIDLGQTASLSTIYVVPSAGDIGVDYTGDPSPGAGSTWIAAAGGVISAADSVTHSGLITGWRLRPIASGAAATYSVRV